jgi:hypothetical protein
MPVSGIIENMKWFLIYSGIGTGQQRLLDSARRCGTMIQVLER